MRNEALLNHFNCVIDCLILQISMIRCSLCFRINPKLITSVLNNSKTRQLPEYRYRYAPCHWNMGISSVWLKTKIETIFLNFVSPPPNNSTFSNVSAHPQCLLTNRKSSQNTKTRFKKISLRRIFN